MTSGVGCSESQEGLVEVLEPFFQITFGSEFFRFLVDFGRISGAKMESKIDFFEVFFDVFFSRDFGNVFFQFFRVFFKSEP